MKDSNCGNERLENLLKSARVSEPSPHLKQRITAEARKVWNQTSAEIPWQIPIGRLVASAAAAVLIVWLANVSSDYMLDRWRPEGASVALRKPIDSDTLSDIPYGVLAKHLASSDRKSRVIDAAMLSDYIENMRRTLEQTQQNGASTPSAPPGDSSRLIPARDGANSYS